MPEQVDVKFPVKPPLEWSFALEHQDRRKEANADAVMHGAPFQVDRSLLRDVVREVICGEDGEHRGTDVARIVFLSSGTFHKASLAYLITLSDHSNLVARVARRFMPNLKTESEVATLEYLRHHTSIPVPKVYHYDSNPYNRLGGEYILMTQAPGTPLATVYHSLSYEQLVRLMRNLAQLIVGDIWRHRFSALGSLYLLPKDAPEQEPSPSHSAGRSPLICRSASGFLGWSVATPKVSQLYPNTADEDPKFTIGPIVSWPFFGSNRGDLSHPDEIFRGPWSTTEEYLASCAERELKGVIRENEGRASQAAPHRIHLDPDEINASRHHRLRALEGVGDESDDSDEYDLDESEDEWAGPGDAMYRDYRRMQRTTFLMVHLREREDTIHNEMGRWMRLMKKLISALESKNSVELGDCRGPEDNVGEYEEFGLDCHDLSLENVFVDNNDPTKITCIIDWESTSTRPLWQCAHLPAFLQSSPFTARLFRQVVRSMITEHAKADACNGEFSTSDDEQGLALLAREWLHYEALGARLRLAHRFVEWDGWEEGLIDTIIGPEEREDEWLPPATSNGKSVDLRLAPIASKSILKPSDVAAKPSTSTAPLRKLGTTVPKLPFQLEDEKERMLDTTGDICGGRGGELGRRLEAWISVTGNEERLMHDD
ncbi:hypothetical protein FISHEDRAFT_44759 [Fistulina hepatica ATCC 64428]|uniref:Aminoglycoside phosphotransferase domain-containing protein n=1 Tax=Fistulina hepatica ATCC 64428 TaxID=1128425 RepID=A0A0D7ABA3_9AGAR|nr:hypothetical protein FISHEDRAFT_44759 [Fistulina hepatica ATCC 64428]